MPLETAVDISRFVEWKMWLWAGSSSETLSIKEVRICVTFRHQNQMPVSPHIAVIFFLKSNENQRLIRVTFMKLGIITQALLCYLNYRFPLFQHDGHLTSDIEAKLNRIK